MADKIVIEGVRRYDGEYDFDIAGEPLTTLEWRWIKKISGYLPLTVSVGWMGEDADLFVAFAVIALHRAGKIDKDEALVVASRFDDSPTAAIRLVGDPVEAEADPREAPEPSEQNGTSGGHSSPTSDPPGQTPSATGSPDSPRSVISARPTLVI